MQKSDYTVSTCVKEISWPAGSPAMDHNGSVSSPPLYHKHLLNDVNDGTGGSAQTLKSPAWHTELGHLVHLARLQECRSYIREQGLSSDIVYEVYCIYYLGVGDTEHALYVAILLHGLENRDIELPILLHPLVTSGPILVIHLLQ